MSDLTRRPKFQKVVGETEDFIGTLKLLGVPELKSSALREQAGRTRKGTIIGFFDTAIPRAVDAAGELLYQNPGSAQDNPRMLPLPDNAYVTNAWYEVLTTFTSAGDAATIAIGVDTDDAAGIVAAVAILTGTPWDAAVPVQCIQDGTVAAFSTKTTAERNIVIDLGGAEVLTAGLLVLVVEYVQTY
jgi:hypothetical protein